MIDPPENIEAKIMTLFMYQDFLSARLIWYIDNEYWECDNYRRKMKDFSWQKEKLHEAIYEVGIMINELLMPDLTDWQKKYTLYPYPKFTNGEIIIGEVNK
jgi:hypothetical protein